MARKSIRSHGRPQLVAPAWNLELARAVRTRRKSLGLTQAKLALLSGCGTAFLYALENGKRSLRLDKLVEVLRVLGLQLRLEPGKAGLSVGEQRP